MIFPISYRTRRARDDEEDRNDPVALPLVHARRGAAGIPRAHDEELREARPFLLRRGLGPVPLEACLREALDGREDLGDVPARTFP
jgi:hypothetical protein